MQSGDVMKRFFVFVSLALFFICFASAELSLTINADFLNYSEDFIAQTSSGATNSFDYAYDAQIPSNQNPAGYAMFYSSVGSKKLAIDSWASASRVLTLGFETSPAANGDLSLSWSFSSSAYDGTLKYCGTVEACSSPIQTVDIEDDSSLTVLNLATSSIVYFKLDISVVDNSGGDTGGDSGGSGGAGGGASGPTTHSLTEAQLSSGAVKSLKVKDKIIFSVKEKNHTLTVNSFTNQSVEVLVESTPKNYIIPLDESILVDVNDDGTKDVSISYSNYSASYVKIELKKASGGFFSENVDKITQTVGETVTKFRVDPAFRKRVLISIFSVLIIVIILIGLIIKILYRKRR